MSDRWVVHRRISAQPSLVDQSHRHEISGDGSTKRSLYFVQYTLKMIELSAGAPAPGQEKAQPYCV